MKYDIVIIGAGASGLSAAYQAARLQPQLNILVLEKEEVPGRKLSAAGNGKCNLTNERLDVSCYHSMQEEIIKKWIKADCPQQVISFFEQMGILMYQSNGYYYPRSNQGKQVTKLLFERCKQSGVAFQMNSTVSRIVPKEKGLYRIEAVNQEKQDVVYESRNVILAAGGRAAPKLGGDKSGLGMVTSLGIRTVKNYPVLCPLYVEDECLRLAKGVRLDVAVTLKGNDTSVKERGQVQFNENCLSGIVMMNLSCYFNQWYQMQKTTGAEQLYLDSFPDLSWEQLREYMVRQIRDFPNQTLLSLLNSILPEPFSLYIIKRLGLNKDTETGGLRDKQINRLTSVLKKLTFTPVYWEDYEKAQVTGGGADLSEMNMDTFECREYNGLYITGELLDVHGICGGYNLTFAVLSGIKAAEDIAGKLRR